MRRQQDQAAEASLLETLLERYVSDIVDRLGEAARGAKAGGGPLRPRRGGGEPGAPGATDAPRQRGAHPRRALGASRRIAGTCSPEKALIVLCQRFRLNDQDLKPGLGEPLARRHESGAQFVLGRAPILAPVEEVIRCAGENFADAKECCEIGLACARDVMAVAPFGQPCAPRHFGVGEPQIPGEGAEVFS